MYKSPVSYRSRYFDSRQVSDETPKHIRTAGMISLLIVTLCKLIIGFTRSAHNSKSSSFPPKNPRDLQLISLTADSTSDPHHSQQIQAWRDTLLTQAGATVPITPAAQPGDRMTLRAIIIGAVLALTLFSTVAKLVLQ